MPQSIKEIGDCYGKHYSMIREQRGLITGLYCVVLSVAMYNTVRIQACTVGVEFELVNPVLLA